MPKTNSVQNGYYTERNEGVERYDNVMETRRIVFNER